MVNFFSDTRFLRAVVVLCAGIFSSTAVWANVPAVSYEEYGETTTVEEYTVLYGNETRLESGTYVVTTDVAYDHTLTVADGIYLIICDGCTMSFGSQDNPVESGIVGEEGSCLYLFDQSRDPQTTGSLVIYASGDAISVPSFYQFGCRVSAFSANGNAIACANYCSLSGVATDATSTGGYGVQSADIMLGEWNLGYVCASSYSGVVTFGEMLGNDDGWYARSNSAIDASDFDQINGKKLYPVTVNIPYIDGNGDEQQISLDKLTSVDASTTKFDAGWYLVDSDVTINQKVIWRGDAHIILCDGCTLRFGTESEPVGDSPCFGFSADAAISLYGQKGRTGTLAINSKGYVAYSSGSLTLNACNLTANCGRGGLGAAFLMGGDVKVNNANVTVNSDEIGIFMTDGHAFNFNGGNVNVGGNGISGTINLHWNANSDRFTCGGFGYTGSITMADGQYCTDGKNVYSGTFSTKGIVSYTKSGDGSVTLEPCYAVTLHIDGSDSQLLPVVFDGEGKAHAAYVPETPTRTGYIFSHWSTQADGSDVIDFTTFEVTDNMDAYAQWSICYIAADGSEQVCSDYTLLTGNETELAAGWYVANDVIAFATGITLTGDIHLILADGAEMSVGSSALVVMSYSVNYSISSGSNPLSATCDVNIYGQANGTGKLIAQDAIAAKNLAINGGVVKAGQNGTTVGIGAVNNITITGGNVTAFGVRGLGTVNGKTTLGWRNTSDRINSNSYSGTIVIADGQTLADGSGLVVSGSLDADMKNSIAGKSLFGTYLLDDTADAPFASLVGQTVNVTLANRTIDTEWNTLTLPFNVPMDTLKKVFGDGVKLYLFGNSGLSEDGVLTFFFNKPDYMMCGLPHFIQATAETANPTFCNVTIADTEGESSDESGSYVDFVPTLGATTIVADDVREVLVLGSGNTLYNPASLPARMKGFRGYFRVVNDEVVANAAQFRMSFDEESEISGIVTTQVMSDELGNKSCGIIYNLMGQRVNRAENGLFIVNGKRVIRP
ncbi:MAG: hypothetical protein E7070_02485 [Bacteroidales bacterium]|nr:hypothetical protein [Bacteroidales bacterium]